MQQEQVWFITGASSGFGRAFTEYALSRQYAVIATARNVTKLSDLVGSHPDDLLTVRMDVDDRGQIEEAVRQAEQHFGRIDVLINNAGYGIVGAVEETPEEELRAQM